MNTLDSMLCVNVKYSQLIIKDFIFNFYLLPVKSYFHSRIVTVDWSNGQSLAEKVVESKHTGYLVGFDLSLLSTGRASDRHRLSNISAKNPVL